MKEKVRNRKRKRRATRAKSVKHKGKRPKKKLCDRKTNKRTDFITIRVHLAPHYYTDTHTRTFMSMFELCVCSSGIECVCVQSCQNQPLHPLVVISTQNEKSRTELNRSNDYKTVCSFARKWNWFIHITQFCSCNWNWARGIHWTILYLIVFIFRSFTFHTSSETKRKCSQFVHVVFHIFLCVYVYLCLYTARIQLLDDGCNWAIFDCKLHLLYRFYWSIHFTSSSCIMANGIVFNLSTFVECKLVSLLFSKLFSLFILLFIHIVCISLLSNRCNESHWIQVEDEIELMDRSFYIFILLM